MHAVAHRHFGGYLRTLRERRGLSLEGAAARSRQLPQTLSAPFLSRCEHGLRLPGVTRLTSLSRILDVPPQVLVERLAIEEELQRTGLAPADELPTDELLRRVRTSFKTGHYWESFAASRALAAQLSWASDQPSRDLLDGVTLCAAWSAARLGCLDLCIHELRHVHRVATGWIRRETATELLSASLLNRGNLVEAGSLAEELREAAVERGDPTALAKATMRAAKIAASLDPASGVERYLEADKAARATGVSEPERLRLGAYILFGLGKCYRQQGRAEAALRATRAFMTRARHAELTNAVDLARIQLGYLEVDRGAEKNAHRLWSEAVESAGARDSRAFVFRATYLLFEQAERRVRATEAERLRARLYAIFPWASGEEEYEAFRRREGVPTAGRNTRSNGCADRDGARRIRPSRRGLHLP